MIEQQLNRAPRHIIILAHPDPVSFNGAIAELYCRTVRGLGHEAMLRDLYGTGFDPVLKSHERPDKAGFSISEDVRREIEIISDADVYVLIYPIWFGMPPAMLKGYIDRVIGSGVTPAEIQHREAQGVVRGKRLLSIITSGAREIWLDEQGQIDALKDVMSRYLCHAFGIQYADHLQFGGVVEGFSGDFIAQDLLDVEIRAKRICKLIGDDRSRAKSIRDAGDMT
jgi:NAD(P)H dehydrogenase (quinone)